MKRILILTVAFLVIGLSLFFFKFLKTSKLNNKPNTTHYYYNVIYNNHVFLPVHVSYQYFQIGIKYYNFINSLKMNSSVECASLNNSHEKIFFVISSSNLSLFPLLFFINVYNFSKLFTYVFFQPINFRENFPNPYFLNNNYSMLLVNISRNRVNIYEGFFYHNGKYKSFFVKHGLIYTNRKVFGTFNQTLLKAMLYAYLGYLWKNYLITFNNSTKEKSLIIRLKNLTLVYHFNDHKLLYVDVYGYVSGRFYPCSYTESQAISLYKEAFENTSKNKLKIYAIYNVKFYPRNFVTLPKYIETFFETEYNNV